MRVAIRARTQHTKYFDTCNILHIERVTADIPLCYTWSMASRVTSYRCLILCLLRSYMARPGKSASGSPQQRECLRRSKTLLRWEHQEENCRRNGVLLPGSPPLLATQFRYAFLLGPPPVSCPTLPARSRGTRRAATTA